MKDSEFFSWFECFSPQTQFTCDEFHKDPSLQGSQTVMVQMQQRHLAVLLAQNEEDGVCELGQLRDVVPPAQIRHLKITRTKTNTKMSKSARQKPPAKDSIRNVRTLRTNRVRYVLASPFHCWNSRPVGTCSCNPRTSRSSNAATEIHKHRNSSYIHSLIICCGC